MLSDAEVELSVWGKSGFQYLLINSGEAEHNPITVRRLRSASCSQTHNIANTNDEESSTGPQPHFCIRASQT